ncbi:MAG: DUF4129 domain-containing protein [Acidimicrobiales bacterium]
MARSDHSAGRDGSGRRGARRARESVALVAAGVILLGIAAWSTSRARTGDPTADLPSGVRGSDAALNDTLLVAAGALAAIVVIFVAPALIRQGRQSPRAAADDDPRPSNVWLRVFGGVMVIFAVVLVIMLAARNRPDQTEPLLQSPSAPEEIRPQAETRSGAHGWSALALAAAGAIAVGAAVVVAHRRGRTRGPVSHGDRHLPPALPREPLDLDALAPTEAVRAAYAAARNELTTLGVELRPPETPYQYLDRVRDSAPIAERPVATLTRLFEVARFSHHPVTPAMKAEAIAAYDTIADAAARARDALVLT